MGRLTAKVLRLALEGPQVLVQLQGRLPLALFSLA
jgi:hypothetical protein